jgi:hypothetical protein
LTNGFREAHGTFQEYAEERMLPLDATRIEDLRRDDLVKIDCAACHGVALANLLLARRHLLRGQLYRIDCRSN